MTRITRPRKFSRPFPTRERGIARELALAQNEIASRRVGLHVRDFGCLGTREEIRLAQEKAERNLLGRGAVRGCDLGTTFRARAHAPETATAEGATRDDWNVVDTETRRARSIAPHGDLVAGDPPGRWYPKRCLEVGDVEVRNAHTRMFLEAVTRTRSLERPARAEPTWVGFTRNLPYYTNY